MQPADKTKVQAEDQLMQGLATDWQRCSQHISIIRYRYRTARYQLTADKTQVQAADKNTQMLSADKPQVQGVDRLAQVGTHSR